MVEKLKTNKSLQRIFVLMSCAVVFFLTFAPTANAFLLDPSKTTMETILSGDMTISYYPTNDLDDEISTFANRIYSVGGVLPYPETTGTDYQGEITEDFLLRTDSDPVWNITTEFRMARYKQKLVLTNASSYTFDVARYKMKMYDVSSSGYVNAVYRQLRFDFDPIFFESYDSTVVGSLMTLRLTAPVRIRTIVTYSWYDSESNSTKTIVNTNVDDVYGNSNIREFDPFALAVAGNHESAILKNVPEYTPLFLESVSVEIQPLDFSSQLNHVQFELLGEGYNSGTPKYVQYDSATRWADYVENSVRAGAGGSGSSGGIVFPEVEANIFTRWLAGAAGGFLDAELFPGFSFGGLFKVIVTVLFVRIILKFLGGG